MLEQNADLFLLLRVPYEQRTVEGRVKSTLTTLGRVRY